MRKFGDMTKEPSASSFLFLFHQSSYYFFVFYYIIINNLQTACILRSPFCCLLFESLIRRISYSRIGHLLGDLGPPPHFKKCVKLISHYIVKRKSYCDYFRR